MAGLLAFLAATNRWMSWVAGYRLLLAHDEIDYRAIARAAPNLPSAKLPEQHAQRFAFHYVIGLIAHSAEVRVESVYAIGVIAVAFALCLVLALILARIGVSTSVFAVCMAVFILNTYSLRYYGIAPAEIADLLFDAGLLVALLGLIDHRFWIVLAGIGFATLARQTALPAAFAVACWTYFGPGWRDEITSLRVGHSVGVVVFSAGLYVLLARVAAPFSASTTPGLAHFTVLADLERLPAGLGNLGQHVLRSINGLLSVAALIAVAVLSRRRSHRAAPLPFEFWGCLLIAASVAIQPLIFSPEYAAHNETRLAVLSLGALVCALAFALRDLERLRGPLAPMTAVALIAVLAVGSLHHLYTVIGTSTASQTVVLQFLAAACLAGLLWCTSSASEHSRSGTAPRISG